MAKPSVASKVKLAILTFHAVLILDVAASKPKLHAKRRHKHHETQPRIVLEDFAPVFPGQTWADGNVPSLAGAKLSMHEIFGETTDGGDVCAGDQQFCSSKPGAPSSFCGSWNKLPDKLMRMKTGPDPLRDASGFKFDQFALEKIMLGKWISLPQTMWAKDWSQTANGLLPDIVVIPSLRLQIMETDGYFWELIEPSTNSNIPMYEPSYDGLHVPGVRDPDYLAEGHANLWSALSRKWYEGNPENAPLIVMHYSFTWDTEDSVATLRALSENTSEGFRDHVVFGVLESNLPINPGKSLTDVPAFFKDWTGTSADELIRRHQHRHSGAPLMIALPYPTAILNTVKWTSTTDLASRRIKILLDGSHKPNAWIRSKLYDQLQAKTKGQGERTVCVGEEWPATLCGVKTETNQLPTVFELAASSVFCLEPPGDTPTRSHFYIAILSGCIPVIFDGGNSMYSQDASVTSWAWRKPPDVVSDEAERGWNDRVLASFIDYESFAIVFNSNDVDQNFIEELDHIYETDRPRIDQLRRGLDDVATRMLYRRDTCGPLANCEDAFSDFFNTVFSLPKVQYPMSRTTFLVAANGDARKGLATKTQRAHRKAVQLGTATEMQKANRKTAQKKNRKTAQKKHKKRASHMAKKPGKHELRRAGHHEKHIRRQD